MVGLGRFELPTSPLSGVRSNQLSYRPAGCARVSYLESFEDQVNMQDGYAIHDHHVICEKQRRLDRFLNFRSGVHGNISYAPAILSNCKSAIAEADECHDVLS